METSAAGTSWSCERVAFAPGEGLCLTFGADPSTQITAEFFDASFHVLHVLCTPMGTAQATWEVGIDGATPPNLFAPNEFSPIVIR